MFRFGFGIGNASTLSAYSSSTLPLKKFGLIRERKSSLFTITSSRCLGRSMVSGARDRTRGRRSCFWSTAMWPCWAIYLFSISFLGALAIRGYVPTTQSPGVYSFPLLAHVSPRITTHFWPWPLIATEYCLVPRTIAYSC
jgi:hypothetical protein